MITGAAGDRKPLIAAYAAIFAAVGALFPYIPVYYASLGIGLNLIGLLAAGSAAASMLGAPLWGAVADHAGPSRRVLSTAALFAATAAAFLSVASGTAAIVLAALALAVCMAGVTPILDARAMQVVGAGNAGYGHLRVWGSLSFIVAVVLTGGLVDAAGIRALFAVLVPALLGTAVVGLAIRQRANAVAIPGPSALASVIRTPVLMRFLAVLLVTWTCATAVNGFYSIHLVSIGAPESLVGIAWALGAAVEVPIMLSFPALERRLGLQRLLTVGAALFAIRAVALVLTRDPVLATLTMVIHGAAFALVLVGGVMYVSRHAPPAVAATAQGMLAGTVFGLAQMLGPGIAGVVASQLGLPWLIALAAAGSAFAVAVLALVLAGEARPMAIAGGP